MLSRISSFSGPLSKLFTSIKDFTLGGLILRYELKSKDSYSGTTTVTDLIGNSNATLTNGPTFSSNGYLNLDGVNDYLITNTSLNSDLNPVNTSIIISLFTWIYPKDNGVIVNEQGTTTIDLSWFDSQIEIVSGVVKFRVWPSLTGFSSSIPITFNKWYYVGFTYDGVTLRGYINGQLAGTQNITRQAPFAAGGGLFYALGAPTSTNLGDGTYAKMKLGAFHVYNTALSTQQVLNNYNSQKSNYIHTDNLVIYLDANDSESYSGSGSTINDMVGSYTHTTTNAPFSTLYGVKSFDCNGGVNTNIRVNGTGPTLSTSGYTYTTWARIKTSSSGYRTLFRANPNDHQILVQIGTDNLGFFDNDLNVFVDSGYDVTQIENLWVQYSVVGSSTFSTFYINDEEVGTTNYGAGGNKHDYWGSIAGQPFGYVANMMLYDTKLTKAQIKQNYDALKHVYEHSNFATTNLIKYFNPDNLISYPGSGSTINDLSGNSLNGTLSNVTFNKQYFTFNGSSSQITINDNSLLEPGTGDWTIEVWINQTVSTGSQVVLGKFDPGGLSADVSYAVRIINGVARCDFGNGTTAMSTTNYTLTTGSWYQLVYVFNNVDNNNVITYVNGVRQSTNTHSFASILNTSANLYIGSYNNGEYAQYFNGKIGITRIYNSALSYTEVLQNFNTNGGTYGLDPIIIDQVVTDGLLLELDANDLSSYPGSGTTWFDLSGGGKNMTLVNSPTYVSSAISYFDFNGINQYATGTGVTVPTTSYTKSVWVWIDAYGDNNIVSGFNGVGGHFLFMGTAIYNKVFVGHHNQGVAFTTYGSTGTISLNTWYNITVTFDTTIGFKIYIDGQLDSSHNMTLAHLGSGTTNLASYSNAGGNYLNGRISKVYTYNRPLTATEVLQNFNADRGIFGI